MMRFSLLALLMFPGFAIVQADEASPIAYGPGRKLRELENKAINESSGLACSRAHPGLFWTHNDSGDSARIFLFDTRGTDLGTCRLEGVRALDWEDMASFTRDGKHYLLIGDIGNNALLAGVHALYLVEEPPLDARNRPTEKILPVARVIHYAYDDDYHNCEALGVDPSTWTILMVSKERKSKCHVYALPWPKDDPKKVFEAKRIATLRIPVVCGMDVSPDGRRALVGTYGHAYEYTRGKGETWAAAFSRPPREIALPRRRQGETFCYGPDGRAIYLTSEKRPTPLWKVEEVR